MNWSNRVTILRILLVPAFIAAVMYYRLNVALCIFIVACITDALDGYLARKRNEKTDIGAILDPIADKLLLVSAFISFSMVSGLPSYIKMPLYVPIVIISRDALILGGAVVIFLIKGDLKVKPSVSGKITTFFQMITVIALLLRFVYSSWLWNITVVLTIISGIDYLRMGARQINEKH